MSIPKAKSTLYLNDDQKIRDLPQKRLPRELEGCSRMSDKRERVKQKPRKKKGRKKDKKTFSSYVLSTPLFSSARYPCLSLSDTMVSIVSYVCHSSATPGQCPSFGYLPSNCSSFPCSSIVWKPETNISGWRMNLLRGIARGWVREGGLFFSGERKNLICRWLSLEVRS